MEFLSTFKFPNRHKNVLSVSIHVESLESLTNVFWIIFSVFEIENLKKLAFRSINRRVKDVQIKELGGGTHGAKPHFKDDIHLPLKNWQTAKNEISIVIDSLAKLSFIRALLFVISFSVKWRGKLSVSESKYKLKMKGFQQIQGSKTLISQLKLILLSSNCFIV